MTQVISSNFWGETDWVLQVHEYIDSQQVKKGAEGTIHVGKNDKAKETV